MGLALADKALTCSMTWGYRSRNAIVSIRCRIQVLALQSHIYEGFRQSHGPYIGHWSGLFIDTAAVLLNNDRQKPKAFYWR
jgi:hypothetical protein